jgi:hypothetical protein
MNLQLIIPIIAAALVVIIAAVVLVFLIFWIRSRRLKNKFGPEYDYTVEKLGDRRAAEVDLKQREKRVTHLEIHPLGDEASQKYHEEWIAIQSRFVDDPAGTVDQANRMITEVMIARGFPVEDSEQRSADLSVFYPELVTGYRAAQDILSKKQAGTVSTEELRQAMVNFHSMFDQLVSITHPQENLMEVAK